MGFKNDTPFSVGRHLRDTMSACLMVANERIHQTNASLLLIAKEVNEGGGGGGGGGGGPGVAEFRAATAEQQAFLAELLDADC